MLFPFTGYEILQRSRAAPDAWGPICLPGDGEKNLCWSVKRACYMQQRLCNET